MIEKFKIDIYPYRGGYGDTPVIVLSVRVPYRDCFGKFKTKYIEIQHRQDDSLTNLYSREEILQFMKETWLYKREIQRGRWRRK